MKRGDFISEIKNNQKKISKLSIWGYCLVSISFIGFFAYYLPSEDGTSWQWIITLLVGSILLAYKNKSVISEKKVKTGALDLLYFVMLLLLAYIPLPYGLNFVLMAILSAILIVPLLNYSLGTWKK